MLLYTLSKHFAMSEENPVEKNVGHNCNDLFTSKRLHTNSACKCLSYIQTLFKHTQRRNWLIIVHALIKKV